MCLPTPKMPEVKVPVTSAPAAPATPPPDLKTDFTDTAKKSETTKKVAKGKKGLRYDNPGLQIASTPSNTDNLKA